MERKEISVLITVYERSEFINDAIRSVLNQDVSPEVYEIIVISNLPIHIVEEKLRSKIKFIETNEREVGKKYLLGMNESTGKIITFLDDDDLYLNNRLGTILRKFKNSGGKIYYHNSFNLINASGMNVKSTFKKRLQEFSSSGNRVDVVGKRKLSTLVKLKKIGADFNMSSIAVSRDILRDPGLLLYSSIKSPDIFLFFDWIKSDASIYIDTEVLTQYRIRDEMDNPINKTVNPERDLNTLGFRQRSMILDFAGNSGNKVLQKYAWYEWYDFLLYSDLTRLKHRVVRKRGLVFEYASQLPCSKYYLVRYFVRYYFLYFAALAYPKIIDFLNY